MLAGLPAPTGGAFAAGAVAGTFAGMDDDAAAEADGGDDEDDTTRLPALKEGAVARVEAIRTDQHFTEPPPRFSEATLVKKLEELEERIFMGRFLYKPINLTTL